MSDDNLPRWFTSYAAKTTLRNLVRRMHSKEPAYFKPTYYYQAYSHALAAFLTAVRADEPPPVDGETRLGMVEHVESATKWPRTNPSRRT